jgi:hypothetical protein
MDVQKLMGRLHETAERLKSAWAKLFATLYPGRGETESLEMEPLMTGQEVEAQSTVRDA